MTSEVLAPLGACGAQFPKVGAPPSRIYSITQAGWVTASNRTDGFSFSDSKTPPPRMREKPLR
jgi:hypothetical protein